MPISYCASLVRTHDHDRYLCTLYAPAEVREAWFVIFAFNHEVAVIGEAVSEEMLGHIRLAWWREALDEIYTSATVRKHPVAEALAEVVHAHALPRAPLDALLEARARDLDPESFTSIDDLETYCRDTSSTLLYLCAQAAKSEICKALDELGIAWALIGMARAQKHRELRGILSKAEKHRDAARAVAPAFTPFLKTCDFYLLRLKAGKGGTPFTRLRLMFCLWRG